MVNWWNSIALFPLQIFLCQILFPFSFYVVYLCCDADKLFLFFFCCCCSLSLTLFDFEITLLMLDADINMLLCASNNFSHKIPIKQQVKINSPHLVLWRWHVWIKLSKKMDRYDLNYIFIISTYNNPINSGMFLTTDNNFLPDFLWISTVTALEMHLHYTYNNVNNSFNIFQDC